MRRVAVLLAVVLLGVTGCSAVTAGMRTGPPAPRITLTPGKSSTAAPPDKGLVVTAEGGTLGSVSVFAGERAVPGSFNAGRTRWRSTWTLAPDTVHVVNATATNGTPATLATRFRTLKPARRAPAYTVTPRPGETVGVGMPIIVRFSQPIADRAAVERALEVRTPVPVEGAWHWFGADEVVYRPRHYWPARTKVRLIAHLTGVRFGGGAYGTEDDEVAFTVGRAMTTTVNARSHQMVVRQDGEVVRRMAISAGMGTTTEYTTTSGVHLTMDKANPVRMISPGRRRGDPGYYDVMIGHAVRISNSGEYVHAKNNVWAQGRANVSHGCVNARPDQAAWFYRATLRGDPVVITGTSRELEPGNGWGYWQLSWDDWRRPPPNRVNR